MNAGEIVNPGRQQAAYECGHLCLVHQGFSAPKSHRHLTPGDMIKITGSNESDWRYELYGTAGAPRRALLLVLADTGTIHHWISRRANRVFDPTDGACLSLEDAQRRFGERIAFALDLTALEQARRSP
jgi:hypothetical protein